MPVTCIRSRLDCSLFGCNLYNQNFCPVFGGYTLNLWDLLHLPTAKTFNCFQSQGGCCPTFTLVWLSHYTCDTVWNVHTIWNKIILFNADVHILRLEPVTYYQWSGPNYSTCIFSAMYPECSCREFDINLAFSCLNIHVNMNHKF